MLGGRYYTLYPMDSFSPARFVKPFAPVKSVCKRQGAKSNSKWCYGRKKQIQIARQYIDIHGSLSVTISSLEN